MAARLWAAFLALSITIGLGICSTAYAQPQCDQRDSVLETLRTKYQEEIVALGVTHNGGLVEVLSKADGSTWSIIVTTPQGMSCLVAAGDGWRITPAQPQTDPGA